MKPPLPKILRLQHVMGITGLSESSLWRKERNGEFPLRLHLGGNSVGWLQSDIEAWIAARPRGAGYALPSKPPKQVA